MTVQDWLNNNKLGIDIWTKKYCYNNETFDEWLDRVSGGDLELRKLILDKKFLFGGRILANRGINIKGKTYSNCYVLSPVEDSIEGIYDACKQLARTFSYGGGCGVDISNLRPKGAKVNNAAQTTTGAVSFMQTLSSVAETIGQNGRRGATMISISINHPDVTEFISIKNDLTKVTGANISVRVSDKFMNAVEQDQDYILHWPCETAGTFNFEVNAPYGQLMETTSINGDIIYYKRIKAKELFHTLCENNWDYAEPGILYWDRITSHNILSSDPNFEYAGVNPCAEEPLCAGGSCLLGSINLAAFVNNMGVFNYEDFRKTVHIATNALNDVLIEGLPLHPLDIQKESVNKWRQIGLGVMGIADMLIKMEVCYDSEDAISICNHIASILALEAVKASIDRAKKYGAYPAYRQEYVVKSNYLLNILDNETYNDLIKYGLFNSQLLTIAPTGSLSTMLQISGGIEPVFAYSYTRTTKSLHGHDETYRVYTKIAKDWIDAHPGKELPDYFVESETIDPIMRVKMQAVWQRYIDASISSTVNLPESTSVKTVEDIYTKAWHNGLKGITIFRSNCKRTAILSKKEETSKETVVEIPKPTITDPKNRIGKIRTLTTGCGTLHLTCFFDKYTGQLVETFFAKGSTGGCNNYMNGLSRMISLSAKKGATVDEIVDQLNSTGACPSFVRRTALQHDTSKGSCCAMAAGYAIKEMYDEMQQELGDCLGMTKEGIPEEKPKINTPICPECGTPVNMTEGCVSCPNCGYSKCG